MPKTKKSPSATTTFALTDDAYIAKGVSEEVISSIPKRYHYVTEAIAGRIDFGHEKISYPRNLGAPHCEDYEENEKLVKGVPALAAIIDKTVDYVVGVGYYVSVTNEEGETNADAEKLCNDFIRNQNFDILLRGICKDMLMYGNAFVEVVKEGNTIEILKKWYPIDMYVKRNDEDIVIWYKQWYAMGQEPVKFEPDQIAHFIYNKIGKDAYGTSLIKPLMTTLHDKLGAERDMGVLLKRKDNAPIHVKVGSPDKKPSQTVIDGIRDDLEVMKPKTEWVTSYLVEMQVLGFADKMVDLTSYIDHYDQQLSYGGQVPSVLMGKASVPEGLAKAQKESFEMRVQSIQQMIEVVLENDIFMQLLEVNNMTGLTPEFEWGVQSDNEKMDVVQSLAKLLNPNQVDITADSRLHIENKLRQLLDIEGEAPEEEEEEPPVPPQTPNPPNQPQEQANGFANALSIPYKETNGVVARPLEKKYRTSLKSVFDDTFVKVKKLVLKQRESTKTKIKEFATSDEYEALLKRVNTEFEIAASEGAVVVNDRTKDNYQAGVELAEKRLKQNFFVTEADVNSAGIIIAAGVALVKNVGTDTAKNVAYETQQAIIGGLSTAEFNTALNEVRNKMNNRLDLIAETETSRAMIEAELNSYTQAEVKKVQWLTAMDERVCPQCEPLDGRIFTMEEAHGMIPLHGRCRCDYTAVLE